MAMSVVDGELAFLAFSVGLKICYYSEGGP